MPIRIHDSLTRELRELRKPDPGNPKDVFSFYNCGLTVYAPGHIGNFRTFVINDVLRRLLILEFGESKVKYVRNLTDVDDKTIRRAREEGRPLAEVTKQWTDKLHADCAALNCLPLPKDCEPAATGYIKEQIDMIDVLMKKGNAYRAADGSVYFKVSSFENYGRLSRVKERDLQLGSALSHKSQAVDADEKEDGSDFALWKAWKPDDGENGWDTPWGRGRPGWHIECSAMSKKILGDTLDLHTGGEDLLFPHHENEIAQSECCNGVPLARHWYHSKHLLVDGAKMSKSLGNFYTLDDLAAKSFSPMALRYALLTGHPQKQLNFTLDSLHSAQSALANLHAYRATLHDGGVTTDTFGPVIAALQDDLNTPAALGALFTIVNRREGEPDAASFDRAMFALGINLTVETKEDLLRKAMNSAIRTDDLAERFGVTPESINEDIRRIRNLAEKRWAAKAAKDFATADALRKEIAAAGWSMLDRKDGYSLEPLKK